MKFFKLLLKDLLSLFKDDKEELYLERFSFKEEIPIIMKIAEEYFSKGDIEYSFIVNHKTNYNYYKGENPFIIPQKDKGKR